MLSLNGNDNDINMVHRGKVIDWIIRNVARKSRVVPFFAMKIFIENFALKICTSQNHRSESYVGYVRSHSVLANNKKLLD